MRNRYVKALYGATALTMLTAMPYSVSAQTQPAAGAPVQLADASEDDAVITVTARRRNESIVDVPLAISVVTSEKLEKLNITSTSQLANFVPGLQFSDFTPGNSRNDRGGNRPIIFRGLNLARNGGVTQAGSMFLDGAAVIGNEIPAGMDIGAVEVLRGPQNVYFGRASMTGAISYRTKAIPDDWTYGLDLTLAERNTHRVEASVAGPISPGLLGVRLTALEETNDGFITNAYDPKGDKLGARSRRSLSGTVDFTPSESLEVKLYANYFHDEDGVSATANVFPDATITTAAQATPTVPAGTVIALGQVTNCLRGIPYVTPGSPAGTVPLPARPTICGRAPSRRLALAYSRTNIPVDHATATFSVPFLQGEDFNREPGMQRNAFNSHGVVNFTISDYLKFQSITGYHTNAVIQVVDGIQHPPFPTSAYSVLYFGLSNKFKDFSQELRLSSDPDRAFSWTVGGTYVNAKNLSNATNTRTLNTPAATFQPLLLNIGDDRAKTYGVFAGAYLKLFDDRLTLSAEGRYQKDKRSNTQLTFPTAAVPVSTVASFASGTFKSFTPRASIDYDVGGGRKVYASYAEGSRPGGFNSGLLSYFDSNSAFYKSNPQFTPATVQASITSVFGVTDLSYDEERLKIWELGFKGNFAGSRGYFDINTYYGTLKDQQVTFAALVPALNSSLSVTANRGELEIYGVEMTGDFEFTRELSVSTSFAYNKTNRKRYFDSTPATIRLYGITDYSGLETPNTPEITGSAVLSYDGDMSEGWAPFANAAAVYRGKQWADIANYAFIKGRATLDLRAGMGNKTLKIEAFVTNVTNNKTYPGGNVASDFGAPATSTGGDQGFFGAYADPRTFGARLSARF